MGAEGPLRLFSRSGRERLRLHRADAPAAVSPPWATSELSVRPFQKAEEPWGGKKGSVCFLVLLINSAESQGFALSSAGI